MASRARDRDFMKIAISEMRKSMSEHCDKVDPMVGAVIVSPAGVELGRTHRGGLRVGDHAEYTLIERLLGSQNLDGTSLYVTLEPCTVRQPPKKPCAERIVSARIRRVIIGIPDPNPDIQGQGMTYLLNNNVEVDFFDADLVEIIRKENQEFIQHYSGATRASPGLQEEEEYAGASEKEKEAVASAKLEDLSTDLIQRYLQARSKELQVPSPELWRFFHQNGFVVHQESSTSYVPTVAGLLLFGKSPEDFLVQSKVKLEARKGDKIVTADVAGPILLMPDKLKEFFAKNMRTHTEIREFTRVDVPEYPWEALREGVMNAIVHRDYKEGARVIITMSEGSIVIRSPGLPLHPLSLDKIRAYNAPPYSRNPRIAETFNHMGLMEERGWGLRRMRDILVGHGLQPPQFAYDSGYFVVTFFGYEQAPGGIQMSLQLRRKLDKREQALLDFVLTKGRVTASECAMNLPMDARTARRYLNKLERLGVVERRGSGPATHYVVTGT